MIIISLFTRTFNFLKDRPLHSTMWIVGFKIFSWKRVKGHGKYHILTIASVDEI